MSDSNTTPAVENVQVARIITIYATRGNSDPVDVSSNAVTWGEFIPEVQKAGYSIDKVLCTEGNTRMDLVNKLAILPTTDFTIFIRNKETKSGAELSYKELRAAISGFIATDGDVAKDHFNKDKNYTTKATADLKELHASYKPKQAGSEEVVEVSEVVEASLNVADIVETVVQAKVVVVTNADRVGKISALLIEIGGNTGNSEVLDRIEMIQDEIAGLSNAVEEDSTATTTEVPTNNVDPAEEGRAQAREEARLAEEASMAAEKKAKEEAEQAVRARKERLAKEAKFLGL